MRNSSDIFFQKEDSRPVGQNNHIFSVNGSPSLRINRHRSNNSNPVFQFGIPDSYQDDVPRIDEPPIERQVGDAEIPEDDRSHYEGMEETERRYVGDMGDNTVRGEEKFGGGEAEFVNITEREKAKIAADNHSNLKRNPLTGAGMETSECTNHKKRSFKRILNWQ